MDDFCVELKKELKKLMGTNGVNINLPTPCGSLDVLPYSSILGAVVRHNPVKHPTNSALATALFGADQALSHKASGVGTDLRQRASWALATAKNINVMYSLLRSNWRKRKGPAMNQVLTDIKGFFKNDAASGPEEGEVEEVAASGPAGGDVEEVAAPAQASGPVEAIVAAGPAKEGGVEVSTTTTTTTIITITILRLELQLQQLLLLLLLLLLLVILPTTTTTTTTILLLLLLLLLLYYYYIITATTTTIGILLPERTLGLQ